MILYVFFTLILVFVFHAGRYFFDRLLLLYDEVKEHRAQDEDEEVFHDRWQELFRNNDHHHINGDGCKELILPLPPRLTCHQLSEQVGCGSIGRHLSIPKGLEIFTATGGKLREGTDYCVSKSPPITCNSRWGYLQYSEVSKLWECRSRVPGIYNATTNDFDACREGGGYLFDKKRRKKVEVHDYYWQLSPVDFWKEPERFLCLCTEGFLSLPELSRSTCFSDPCLSHLPSGISIPGYRLKDGTCDCGRSGLYTNLQNDPWAPCTACPNDPFFDEDNDTITIWIKCDGYYPCKAPEDLVRGCMQVKISAKKYREETEKSYTGKENEEAWQKRIIGL